MNSHVVVAAVRSTGGVVHTSGTLHAGRFVTEYYYAVELLPFRFIILSLTAAVGQKAGGSTVGHLLNRDHLHLKKVTMIQMNYPRGLRVTVTDARVAHVAPVIRTTENWIGDS